jgi:hypothetical protein
MRTGKDLQRLGYDDATGLGHDLYLIEDPNYRRGYLEGLQAKLKWVTEELEQFNERFPKG